MRNSPRILFLAPTRIGDGALASSLLAHIAERSPDARVTLVTSPFARDIYLNYPPLERLVVFSKRRHSMHWPILWSKLVLHRWDEVWDMYGSGVSYLLWTKSRRIFFGGRDKVLPKVKQFEVQLKTGPLPYPQLWPSNAQRAKAAQLLPQGTNHLMFGPCANWPPKEWPMEFFAALGQILFSASGTCAGWRPVIVCAPNERDRAIKLLEALAPFRPIDLTTGEHDLLTIYACMERAQGYIGNDSGLMHMAAASGAPTLGLYGATAAKVAVFLPWGKCGKALLAPNDDLALLTPETVAEAFAEFIEPLRGAKTRAEAR